MSQQEPQQDKVPSFEESSLYVEDDYSEKKEDDSMMTPSTETSDVAVEEKEEKEIMVSYGSLLDQEIGQSDSRESESESGTEDTRNNVQERNIVTDGGDGDVSDDYDVDDDYDVVVDNDEESLGEILRATSSDSTFSEIPPPPPPDECSVGPDDEDVPTDEECSPQRKIRKPEAPLQESTVVSPPSSSPNRTNLSNHKTKIAARLIKAVDDSEPGNHRSPELVPLKKNYQIFRKMLKTMIKSTKSYQKATLQLSEARTKVRCKLNKQNQTLIAFPPY